MTDEAIKSYRDLTVWRKAMNVARGVYHLTDGPPKKEEYRMSARLIRATISIPANIAEGNARGARKDNANFVSIAHGSKAEPETLLMLAQGAGFDREDAIAPHGEFELRQGTVGSFIVLAINAFAALGGSICVEMRAFVYWMMMERPAWIRDDCPGRDQMAAARDDFPNRTKAERFAALLSFFNSQSPIPNPQSP